MDMTLTLAYPPSDATPNLTAAEVITAPRAEDGISCPKYNKLCTAFACVSADECTG